MFLFPRIHIPSICNTQSLCALSRLSTASVQSTRTRLAKSEGTIADVFTTLGPNVDVAPLPPRFAALKRELLMDMGATPDGIQEAWNGVLTALETRVKEIIAKGGEIIPRVPHADVEAGLSDHQKDAIRKTGVVVVTGAVPQEEALAWKASIKDYIAANPVKGFPPNNIQAYEIYNARSQILARTHPALLRTQKTLLKFWNLSSASAEKSAVDFSTPISYFDRLRMRTPGDRSFTLGPHVDGGSVERWEDPTFRRVFGKILSGGNEWTEFDPFDASWRIDAKQDLYNAPNQCSILRCWQGWTSLSRAGPHEGTLRVLPMLSLATAYIILRPFFKPRPGAEQSLAAADWEINLDGPEFPGSIPGKSQELNETTHPHLKLGQTMLSVPEIKPGDQVYWHCDIVHAVEHEHMGKEDSSVLYIPAVPLSVKNASYLRDQRINFMHGLPAPDFPGGEGESRFVGRGTLGDVKTREGRQALGFEPFVAVDEATSDVVNEANKALFG